MSEHETAHVPLSYVESRVAFLQVNYVIGMTLTKGRIQTPGVYSADSRRLRLIH